MRYVDEALEGFFATLASRSYAKDTVVALYGDHESRIMLDHAGEAEVRAALSLDAQTAEGSREALVRDAKDPAARRLPECKGGVACSRHVGRADRHRADATPPVRSAEAEGDDGTRALRQRRSRVPR